ncbi:hypothetical protein BDD43_1480 [Mucilaginibacter gracilis]|uniref:Lipid-binding hydrolase n=1 Tax=Mucilaginibacter gracilis TaxID=423350 RepID=A0A495IXC8_9SPHI|nr:DUF6252 family protein [Mucilaginibacter gracilis]RKR81335.1 hypothetical protein BDD43_1480 [Mucilaginibacter gracilis]
MKNRLILCLAVAATMIMYACKKTDDKVIDTNFYMTALNNNNSWTAIPFAGFLGDSLYLQGSNSEKAIMMKIKFGSLGKYPLTGNQSLYVTNIGGDVLSVKYVLRADTVSSVTLTSYDADKQIFEGTFDLSFIQTFPVVTNPAKVSFSNGKFRIRRGAFEL